MQIEIFLNRDTPAPGNGGGRVPGGQAGEGDFDLAVAAVSALFLPVPAGIAGTPQGQSGAPAGAASCPEGGPGSGNPAPLSRVTGSTAGEGILESMIRPRAPGEGAGGETSTDMLLSPRDTAVQEQEAAVRAEGPLPVLKRAPSGEQGAAAGTGRETPAFASRQDNRAPSGTVSEPGPGTVVVQAAAVNALKTGGGTGTGGQLSSGGKDGKFEKELFGYSLPGNASAVEMTENKSVFREVKVTVPTGNETSGNGVPRNGEEGSKSTGKGGDVTADSGAGLINRVQEKVNGTVQAHNGRDGTATGNPVQPGQSQPEAGLAVQNPAGPFKGVALPELKERVIREIRRLNAARGDESRTEVQLRLEPENLGHLTIKLFFSKGELSAHFYTGSSQVKEVLEGAIQQLRDALGQQDLRLNEALVFAGDAGGGNADRYPGERGRHTGSYGGYNYRPAAGAPAEATDTPPVAVTTSSRVNYLV